MSGSMTGWGTYKTNEINVSIRGLNSKYKEIFLHLPQELFDAEPYIYKIVNEKVLRGRIDVFINFNVEKVKKKYVINDFLFADTYKRIKDLFGRLKIRQDVPMEYILRDVEGVAATRMLPSDNQISMEKIKEAVICGLNDFEKSKRNEGRRLIKNIKTNVLRMEQIVKELKIRFADLRQIYAEKAKEKIRELFKNDKDKKFFDINVVEILEKYEITEELVRLNSHIKQLLLMIKGDCNGRKIDFFAQEIYREANTITSKIQDARVTSIAIEIKERSEKIREQAQNLE